MHSDDIYIGGNRCSIELAEFALRLFGGQGELLKCKSIPNRYISNSQYKNNLLVSFIPEACGKAVKRGFLLYKKLFSPVDRNINLTYIEMNTKPKNQFLGTGVSVHMTKI